jgi:hypothetical protein
MLAPALAVAVAWAIWDRHGRPEFAHLFPGGHALGGLSLPFGGNASRDTSVAVPRPPRNPATMPIPDERSRATRQAARHVRAALHGAGSRGGLP